MSVIISRSKKHVALGRLLNKSSVQIGILSKSRHSISSILSNLNALNEFYTAFEADSKDIPPGILATFEEDKASLEMLAKSTLLLFQAMTKELDQASKNLSSYEKELQKAERNYQKLIEKDRAKAAKEARNQAAMVEQAKQAESIKPEPPKPSPEQIEAVTKAILSNPLTK